MVVPSNLWYFSAYHIVQFETVVNHLIVQFETKFHLCKVQIEHFQLSPAQEGLQVAAE